MNPADANSSLATLRQLKEMLDAGTLTPQEFEALKQKLVFGKEPSSPASKIPAPATSPITPPPASAPPMPLPFRVELPTALDATDSADWLAVSAPIMLENTLANEAAENAETPEQRRNSLTTVFIIGGVLLLLAIVLYLALGTKTPDEHLTSTSQTAADSAATVPETGPQANQIT
ncbi:MAG: SHOCT domain-containing protein, partial [Hymenobacter sp.]